MPTETYDEFMDQRFQTGMFPYIDPARFSPLALFDERVENGTFPPTGAEIVLEAHELINGDRASAYGHPLDDYQQVTDIFYALTGIRMSAEQGQLFMKSVKLTRLVNNLKDGVFHRDSAVDDIGYMGTLGKTAQRRAERGEQMQWFFHND